MKNQNANDLFLKDMQMQCLQDTQAHIEGIRAALLEIAKDPRLALSKIMSECHSLKGNFQAVGFAFCGQFLHELEDELVYIDEKLKTFKFEDIQLMNFANLEFLLSDTLTNLVSYIEYLSKGNADGQTQMELRSASLMNLKTWDNKAHEMTEEVPVAHISPAIAIKKKAEINQPKKQEVVKNSLYLLCTGGEQNFAIPIQQVVEVVQEKVLTDSPCERGSLRGLMNLRGDVLPVLDLSHIFGEGERDGRGFVVICENKGNRFGFSVGHAEQILELNSERFQDLSGFNEGAQGIIGHSFVDGAKVILVVNMDKAIAA